MAITRSGIYHNLNESEYAISNGEIAFFFSSQFYLGKFIDEYKENREIFKTRIARAMTLDNMNTDCLADINLYKEIEKRGFRVIFLKSVAKIVDLEINVPKGDNVTWQELNQFALGKMINKSTDDWSEMPVRK